MTEVGTLLVVVGGGLSALVSVQLMIAFANSWAKVRADAEHKNLSLRLLRNKMEAMKVLHKEYEQSKRYSWTGYRKFRVDVKKELSDVTSCYFRPHDGKKLPPFKPGQFLTFQFKLPDEDKPLIRCYSLSDKPNDEYYRISVKKILPPRDKPELPSGKSSTYINEVLKSDEIIDVKIASGNFYLETREHSPIVLIGGGIGVTPVYSMLRTLAAEDSEREVWFFYGLRNKTEQLYSEELKEIARTHPNMHICLCYSNPEPDDKEGEDYQYAERVSVDLFKRVLHVNNYVFYICGPPPMMNSLVSDLEAWDVPSEHVRFEAFGPASVKKTRAKKKDDAASQESFAVKFSRSGKECQWTGEEDSILELATANDIGLAMSCGIGNCGTCMVALKKGTVDYPAKPGFDFDAGTCLPCIARPTGPVEIDG
ncbi:MAG: 2Fe-2S iron-sulfur cluster-binding protein [Mariprofundus sp.]|nr:2Fe-2S iron-sulfur cluster-binding protein [Mariprofundus sp.]